MCGIFGYARLKEHEVMSREDVSYAVQILTLENEVRGRDSTGLAVINKDGRPHVIRKVKDAEAFLETNFVKGWLSQMINRETRQVFGHTRFATTGKVNLNNAQPFIFGDILGTHNGVINNYKKLFKKNKLKPRTTCDSEVIFALLSKAYTLKDKAKMLDKLRGYYSIAFHDLRTPEKIYFARGNNVLSLYKSIDNQFIFWSSQDYPIGDIVDLLNIEVEEIKLSDGELIAIDDKGNIERETIFIPKHTSPAREHYSYYYGHQSNDFYWTKCQACNRDSVECTYNSTFDLDLCRVCSLDYEHRYGGLYNDGLRQWD